MNADELQDRLIDFAIKILALADSLPNTPAGRHVRTQIIKSGTSPAPNYSEARGAESNADFIHKHKIVLKELNETEVWLQIILRRKMLKEIKLKFIINENSELCKIIASTIKTAKQKKLKS
jgi:four helix bundle protein